MASSPAERLVTLLTADRRRGLSFAEAWQPRLVEALADVDGVERTDWLQALTSTSDEWCRAFERRPGISCELGGWFDELAAGGTLRLVA